MTATSWPDAVLRAHSCATPLEEVLVDLPSAVGCVLARPVVALVPLPPFDTAAMDGWAVAGPAPWEVRGAQLAGATAGGRLAAGTAVEVATGSAVPAGTDAVLRFEDGVARGGQLRGKVAPGKHIRRAGEEARPDDVLLHRGQTCSPAAVNLAAAAGHDVVSVHRRPRVHALVTGDELLSAGLPGSGRIRDAIGPGLTGAVGAYGGCLVALDHVRDNADSVLTAIASADADVVVTTGASSVGPADFLPAALTALHAERVIDGVRMRPGHPQLLARLPDGRLVVGLPGNPLAALAGLVTVLHPVLAGLGGQPPPRPQQAISAAAVRAAPDAHRLVPVRLREGKAHPTAHDLPAMLRGAAVADAFAVVPPGADVQPGQPVEVAMLPGADSVSSPA